jgi:hypothetical protein
MSLRRFFHYRSVRENSYLLTAISRPLARSFNPDAGVDNWAQRNPRFAAEPTCRLLLAAVFSFLKILVHRPNEERIRRGC